MKKLSLDTGIISLPMEVDGVTTGTLRFAPGDINLYQRLVALVDELPEQEKKYVANVEGTDALHQTKAMLNMAKEIDADVKRRLSEIFGQGNDFEALLSGVNIMSVAGNGERVITNFLGAIMPYIEEGVKKYMDGEAGKAKAAAKDSRAKREAR